jgi:hypothetical protein
MTLTLADAERLAVDASGLVAAQLRDRGIDPATAPRLLDALEHGVVQNIIALEAGRSGRTLTETLRTLTEAKKFKGKVAAGEARPTSSRSFKSYATEWIDVYAGRNANGIGDDTRASYADAIKRIAVPYFRTTRMDRIDAPKLRADIKHLEGKKLAPATLRRYYAPVRALLATAYDDGLILTQPNVRVIVKGTRPAERKRPRRKHLTAEETKRLLVEIPEKHADLSAQACRAPARTSSGTASRR